MAKITLDIDDKHLSTVLGILNNLKNGLINNIQTNTVEKTSSSSLETTSKYLSKNNYKQKVNQNVLEDESTVKNSKSNTRYLSKAAYKQRLNK